MIFSSPLTFPLHEISFLLQIQIGRSHFGVCVGGVLRKCSSSNLGVTEQNRSQALWCQPLWKGCWERQKDTVGALLMLKIVDVPRSVFF